MAGDEVDWESYLADFHTRRPGAVEAVLSQATAGDHTPYRWLARAISGPVRTVLDLACGSGAMSRELAAPDRTVIGIDISAAELKLAAERSPGPWIEGDIRRLPLRDGSVDAVTASLGLIVVPELDRVLAEVARVLRPGGVLAAIAPALRGIAPRDLRVLTRVTARLHTKPQFPGNVEVAGFKQALIRCGMRRVEDARQRYGFWVTSRADAETVMSALYLPETRWSRVESAIEHLEDRVRSRGPFELAIPMRRLVAIK
ncbi:methyltransferase domain-containing protein [Microlunatus elymi]|uniref:Methyltransferase domain-containing protein n=1 Tax=Microlunatus elymi TaxID=2596828 RepID=A0A516Q3N7_9ACTN|nr:methyltransferase domain-containing protein [Microlunatus elymi]QDP98043.1 methyltransferase domain-containing protein [Microlunatus elymi]